MIIEKYSSSLSSVWNRIGKARKSNIVFITIFLLLLGSQLFVSHLIRLSIIFTPFVKWKKIITPGFLLLFIFAISAYQKEYFFSFEFAQSTITIPGIIVLLFSYLIGLSVTGLNRPDSGSDKKIFYLLTAYIIGNVLAIEYSFFVMKQDIPLTGAGIFVFYDNMYNLHNIRGGRLVSTVASYSLVIFGATLPLLLLNIQEFKKRKFNFFELLFIFSIMMLSLFIMLKLGRRIGFVVLSMSFIYLLVTYVYRKELKLQASKIFLYLVIFLLISILLYYYLLKDSLLMVRLDFYHIIHDKRFTWWIPAIKSMISHPLGGGYADCLEPTGHCFRSAHNTWLDIGKSNGVIAFSSLILFHLWHIKYYINIFKNKNISNFIKNLIAIITIAMVSIMMIEPIFRSQKTLFFYSVFFLGFLKAYSDIYQKYTEEIK